MDTKNLIRKNLKSIGLDRLSEQFETTQIRVNKLVKKQAPIIDLEIYENKKTKLKKILLNAANGEENTILVLSSLSIDREHIKDIVGILHYETRSLWEILKAENKNTKIIYFSSFTIDEDIIEHTLSMLPNSKSARERITFISLNDLREEICLTQKIFENKKILEEVRAIINKETSYINNFISSELEYGLSNNLDIPMFGFHPKLANYVSKSGNRKIFKAAATPHADGFNDIVSSGQLVKSIEMLWKRNKKAKKFVVKLDEGVSGKGNAILNLPMSYRLFSKLSDEQRKNAILKSLKNMKFISKEMTWKSFEKLLPNGSIVEVFIEGNEKTSPSVQGIIMPDGSVKVVSTHEQLLDQSGATFLGSRFPAKSIYRKVIQKYALKVGNVLASTGIIGPFSVDFLYVADEKVKKIWAIEINLRQGGTTHPFYTAKLASKSTFDLNTGILISLSKDRIFYESNDNIVSEKLKSKKVKELIDFMKKKDMIYNRNKNKGVIFHLLSAMETYGKIGYTAIGTTRSQAHEMSLKVQNLINEFISS